MDIKLSFILPIYKVEAYLPQCVESILSQMPDCCEIILVDDGSPDGCGAICDRYAAEYDAVTVIHKPNGGLSDARNAGFRKARGAYVLFVDSDDYIEPNSVEKILNWIDESPADVGFLQSRKVYPDGTSEPMGEELIRERIRGVQQAEAWEFLSGRPKFPASAWGKIYRRAFLEENSLYFPADRRLSEDLSFSLDVFLKAESMDVLEFPYYCYRQNRAGSITNTVSPKYYFDTSLFVTETAARFAPEKKADAAGARLAMSYAAYEYAILVWQALDLTGEDRKRARAFLKEYRWVLPFGMAGKTKLVNLVVGALGVNLAARILDVYMKNR